MPHNPPELADFDGLTKDRTAELEREIDQLRAEVDQLKKLATRRGARMQVMREWMETRYMLRGPNEWFFFCRKRPEAEKWFYADGVPVGGEVEK